MDQEDLERLFAQREEIDRALVERQRELVVLFTDIVGSTRYFEERGDIEGMKLLRRHNDLLFPLVTANKGQLIKTIGDAIMAVFDGPDDAVRCAVAMHQALAAEGGQPRIHIRVGAHHGRAFATGKDVFGDTVNTAARIVHEAKGDEILLSKVLVDRLAEAGSFRFASRGALPLKGKADPLPVVSLLWNGEPPPSPEPSPAGGRGSAELFVLELQRGPSGLKVSAIDGSQDKGTVKSYAETPIQPADLDALSQGFATFMQRGGVESYRERIRERGAELFQRAMSERARRHLTETRLSYLRLHLDDTLVQVPWELMHDGAQFLCLRFALGRVVAAQSETSPGLRRTNLGGTALVVSNASGDLPAAQREGEAIAGLLRDGYAGPVKHLTGPVSRDAFFDAVAGCSVLHFAGHVEQETAAGPGGFRLADGVAAADEVARIGKWAPVLVFANGCGASSGKGFVERARGVSDLASSFLLRGTQHYLGPQWDISDADALAFALRFYEAALSGAPFGEAVRQAREALFSREAQPLSFAGYVLYGDPRTALPSKQATLPSSPPVRSTSSDRLPRPAPTPPRPNRLWLVPAGAVVAALVAGVFYLRSVRSMLSEKPAPAVAQPVATAPTAPLAPKPNLHQGPLRICVFPFKNVSGDGLKLGDALEEAVYTDFGQNEGVKLIERGQIDLDVGEMDFQAKYADPATRTALGKLTGAEVALVGGYQHVGKTVRVFARFIDVETGEILHAFRLDGPESKAFDLEEQVASRARDSLHVLKTRLRP